MLLSYKEGCGRVQLEDSIFDCSSVSDIDGANMSHDNDGPNVTFRSESSEGEEETERQR